MSDILLRLTRSLEEADRARMIREPGWQPDYAVPIVRFDGITIDLAAVDHLMTEFRTRWADDGGESDPESGDGWLAPRLHWALRLSRAEAADRGLWQWIAVRYSWYVEWRWGGSGDVAENRWRGAVNKQAFARLWWGGELFRDGQDYAPVVRAFQFQDLPNSYLHRPVIRCRPLALGLVDAMVPPSGRDHMSADEVNDLARVVNIALAGTPPEAELGYPADDVAAYLAWIADGPAGPFDWEELPMGPRDSELPDAVAETAAAMVERCVGHAPRVARTRGTRSARRRRATESTVRVLPSGV